MYDAKYIGLDFHQATITAVVLDCTGKLVMESVVETQAAAIVEAKFAVAQAGEAVCIQNEFAANTPYALFLEIREDSFDPAQADPMLRKEAG